MRDEYGNNDLVREYNLQNIEPDYNNDSETMDVTPKETAIIQSIISGLVIIIILLISFFDIPLTESLRSTIQESLTGATTVSELIDNVQQFGEDWLGWGSEADETLVIEPHIHIENTDVDVIPSLWD